MSKRLFARPAFFKRRPRLFVRPTAAGAIFLAFIIAVLLMAAIYSNMSLQLLGFFLLGLYALAMVWTHAELRGLLIGGAGISPAPSGEVLRLDLEFESTLALDREKIHVEARFRREGDGREWTLVAPLGRVTGRGPLIRAVPVLATAPRGRWRAPRLTLWSRAPFGLFHVWTYRKDDLDLWVYPALAKGLRPGRATGAVREESAGGLGEEDFSELRESHRVTSASRVAAKPARQESLLLLKEFDSDRGGEKVLDWSELGGSLEDKLSLCAGALYRSPEAWRVRTPYFEGRVVDEEGKGRALEAWAAAPGDGA